MDDCADLSETLTLASGSVPVIWRRSSRARRISLRIDARTASVVVTLPMRAARGAGIALLTTHQDWAAGKLAALPQAAPFADGGVIPLHGAPHRIRHLPGARGAAWARDGEIVVAGRPEFLARRVLDFLRAEARLRLSGLARAKAEAAGLAYTRLTIKDTSSRWGSCASNGALAFSWRLVMAPPEVQDYVAAHEVAHLRHMNHGRRFWALVRELTPHADVAMPWLHQHGARLLRVGQATPARAPAPAPEPPGGRGRGRIAPGPAASGGAARPRSPA